MKTKNFISKLKEWQKITIIVIITSFMITTSVGGWKYVSDPTFKESFNGFVLGKNKFSLEKDSAIAAEVTGLRKVLSTIDDSRQYYKEYSLAELDIYPESYIKRIFNSEERKSDAIAGPSGDPDGDGLINKLEFFYGSDPKKASTLCDGIKNGERPNSTLPFTCTGKNDRQLVDDYISPLTGLDLDTPKMFRILNQDFSVINNMKENYEKAAEEGVDFTVLYQLSKTINLEKELDNYKVIEQEDNATNILKFREVRIQVLEDLVSGDEVSSLSQIYSVTKPEQFENIAAQYQKQLTKLKEAPAPKKFVLIHKIYQLIFQKLVDLTNHRAAGLKSKISDTPEFKEKSKKLSIETTWGYRRVKEEQARNRDI